VGLIVAKRTVFGTEELRWRWRA